MPKKQNFKIINFNLNHQLCRIQNVALLFVKATGGLDPTYMTKTHHLNGQESSLTHRQHIKTHRKKFADLLEESNSPFLSPYNYDSMTAPHFTSPSFHVPLSTTTPKQKTETTLKTEVNFSDAQLSPTELEVLNLGLKFVPTPKQINKTPQLN